MTTEPGTPQTDWRAIYVEARDWIADVQIFLGLGPEATIDDVKAVIREGRAEARAARDAEVRAAVEDLIEKAGGRCVVPDDDANPICERHSELLFDGACEDQPRQLLAVLAVLDADTPS